MHIYFSGIGGVGIGPLIQVARDAGYTVSGSDLRPSLMTKRLEQEGIEVAFGQDGTRIAALHQEKPIDWFVYTAAIDEGRPELDFCEAHGIRTSKRDELLAHIVREKGLELVAVSGSHGKTTTTGMLVWTLKQLKVPVSYSVGTTLSFGPSGHFERDSTYFVYECDEYDRNMLHFEPRLSIVTSLGHDHVDTYPTEDDYRQAFVRFVEQSGSSVMWERDLRFLRADPRADLEAYDELMDLSHITLAGDHMRHNAFLVQRAVMKLLPDMDEQTVINALNAFPGTNRRFEKLADNLYTDYGHHPAEIAATLQMARELSDHVVLVYQPHQNIRQHQVRDQYTDCTKLADTVYWLPTYLSREDPDLEVLTPQQLTENLSNRDSVRFAEMNDELWKHIEKHRSEGSLVLVMGAGDVDDWVRDANDDMLDRRLWSERG